MPDDSRLDELNREEWWEVAKRIDPNMTREQFDADWEEFCRLKAARRNN